MKEKGYYKHWVLPECGLFNKDYENGDMRYYETKPVGNSPELMPLDSSLNRDIHIAVQRHVALTNGYENDDERKFQSQHLIMEQMLTLGSCMEGILHATIELSKMCMVSVHMS